MADVKVSPAKGKYLFCVSIVSLFLHKAPQKISVEVVSGAFLAKNKRMNIYGKLGHIIYQNKA